MKTRVIQTIVSLSVLLMVRGSYASNVLPYEISDAEMKRLPPYCFARMKTAMNSPEYTLWRGRIGQNFGDYYHYCHGLNFINRYWGAKSAKERAFYLEQAKGEFDYMVNAEKPDYTMRAELYANRGEVFRLMGKIGEAVRDFQTSIKADPKQTRTYIKLAELYANGKEKARALEIISQGLRYNPDSKALQRRYLELGGKQPFPEILREVPESSAQLNPVEPVRPAARDEVVPPSQTREVVQHKVQGEDASTQANSPTGNSKNPYCRFCPAE